MASPEREVHLTFGYTGERRRTRAAALVPPLTLLPRRSVEGVYQLPLIADGRLFIGRRPGTVLALAEDDGSELWKFELGPGEEVEISLLLTEDALLVQRSGELLRLRPADGQLLDRRPVPDFDLTSAVLEGGILVGSAGHQANAVYVAMRLDESIELWRRAGAVQRGPITLAGGAAICLRTGMHSIAAWGLESGSPRWELDVAQIGSYTDDGHPMKGEPAGVAIAVDETIYLGVVGYRVVAVDAASGDLRWQTRTPVLNSGNLVYDPAGRLHLLDSEHYVSLEASSGDVVADEAYGQKLQVEHHIVLPTALDVGTEHLFGADFYGTVFALNKKTHAIDWSERFPSRFPTENYPVAVGGHLYVLDSAGTLHVFAGGG